ncbi:penicillin-binding protein 2B [Verrucomicrobiota bacterium]|nr:penicillin-binding protein 2B [Verrucomicrobiota bacterium]
MGHSVSVTAMQMHYAMSVIAADGLLMQPQLVLRVEDPKTRQVVLAYPPRSRGRAISARTAGELATLLRAVCGKGGTAPIADIPGYEVAGKTGTTQKIINGKYSTTHHVLPSPVSFPWATRAWPSPSSSTNPRARASPTAARSPPRSSARSRRNVSVG